MQNLQDFIIIDIPSGNCAVCRNEDGVVVNTIVANPEDPVQQPGVYLIGIELNMPVTEGCKWDGENFLDKDGNILKPTVPETRCAVVDQNCAVINFALAQIDVPYVYKNDTLVPITEEQIVAKGFFWSGSEFLPPYSQNAVLLKIDKSIRTIDFLDATIQGQVDNLDGASIPYGFVETVELNESFDIIKVQNVINTFDINQKISNTNSFENCPIIIDVIQETNNG